jgi:hypothetical protein
MEFWLKVFRLLILAKNSIIWGDIQKENIPKHLGDVIRSIQDPYTFSYIFAEDNIFYFGHLKLLSTFKKEFEKYKKETK